MKKLLTVSITLNLIFILVAGVALWKKNGVNYVNAKMHPKTPKYSDNVYYQERTSLFNEFNIPKGSIVFIGDSLTQRSEWNELFPGKNIVNRGIGSDTTEGVLHRLNSILESKPKKIFLMIGINDLSHKIKIPQIESNYSNILNTIKASSPVTEVYVESVMPVNRVKYGKVIDNQNVILLNKGIQKIANNFNDTYINVYSKVEKNNELPSDLTVDGIHLKGKGYLLWRSALMNYVD